MKICTFDGRYARYSWNGVDHATTAFHPGAHVYEDLSPNAPSQLCYGLRSTGGTIAWADSDDDDVVAEAFAKDIGAKLIPGDEYDVALAALKTEWEASLESL